MRRRGNRLVVMVLLVAMAVTMFPGGAPAQAAAGGEKVPVILIHGFMTAADTWRLPPRRGGLYHALVKEGYVPDETLFWLAAEPWRDPVESVHDELIPLLQRVKRQTGAVHVDVVVHANGMLDVQQLLAALDREPALAASVPRVRQIVALAPMHQGHEAAQAIRLSAFKVELLDWHHRWSLPRNTHPLNDEIQLPEFNGEVAYVIERAHQVYQPLYHRFLRDSWFFGSRDSAAGPSFWEWLAVYYPSQFRHWLVDDPPSPGGEEKGWPEGTDLSRLYYEIAAFEAARYAYRNLQPLSEVFWDGWRDDLQFQGDWRETLARFMLRRSWHVLRTQGPSLLEEIQDRSLRFVVQRMVDTDPLGTPLRRLVPRSFADPQVPLAPRITNLWNNRVALPAGLQSRPGGPRIVAIFGRPTGPLQALLGRSKDLADIPLDLASDLDDEAIVISGWWGVDDRRLVTSAAARNEVIRALRWQDNALELVAPAQGERTYRIDPLRPAYFRAGAASPAGGGIELKVSDRAAGPVALWRSSYPGGERLEVEFLQPGQQVALEVDSNHTWGLRPLAADGQITWSPYTGAAAGIEVTIKPVPVVAGDPGHWEVSQRKLKSHFDWVDDEVWTGDDLPAGIPLIRVILRSKQTTLWQDQRGGLASLHFPEPVVDLRLVGPSQWVVGRPALYSVEAHVTPPPGAFIISQEIDPGEQFAVLWERPGKEFEVKAALRLKIRYPLQGGAAVTETFVYTTRMPVNVLAIGSDGGA